jgi:predicted ribosomally synthesized peptide with nif11-like leader
MSLEKAKAFLDKVRDDPKFRTELQHSAKTAWQGVIKVAHKHGYDCTLSDMHNALRERLGAHHIAAAKNDDEANCIFIAPK